MHLIAAASSCELMVDILNQFVRQVFSHLISGGCDRRRTHGHGFQKISPLPDMLRAAHRSIASAFERKVAELRIPEHRTSLAVRSALINSPCREGSIGGAPLSVAPPLVLKRPSAVNC